MSIINLCLKVFIYHIDLLQLQRVLLAGLAAKYFNIDQR